MANEKNLIPLRKDDGTMTEEEKQRAYEIRSKGAKALNEKRRAKKNLQETMLTLLEREIPKEDANELVGNISKYMDDDNMTIQALIAVKALDIALNDNSAKMFEFIRDTSGQKPKDVQEIKADIMTESDKRLLENVAKRVKVSTDDGQTED